MLDQKLHVLRVERQRFVDRERVTSAAWQDKQATADRLVLRAALLGGHSVDIDRQAEVTVRWTATVGVRHPATGTIVVADWVEPPSSPSVASARNAAVEAATAAVDHAVATWALRAIDAELTVTALRVRSLRRHWLPRLSSELAAVEFELEEQERAEAVRRRWATVRD